MKFTNDEKKLLDSVEQGEWQQISDSPRQATRYRDSARASLRKDKRVNIRMTERDLVRIQKNAMREGLPYQTYISSILHKFINGRLLEKTN